MPTPVNDSVLGHSASSTLVCVMVNQGLSVDNALIFTSFFDKSY